MNKLTKWAILFSFLLLLVACGEKGGDSSYFTQTDFEEINQYFEGGKKGFVFIVVDNNEPFVKSVEQIANQEKVKVLMYNPYQPDGKNEIDINGKPTYPKSSSMQGNALFYMEDNKVVDKLAVRDYEGSGLVREVTNLFNLHK